MRPKEFFFISLFLAFPFTLFSQTDIKGTVYDIDSGEPLTGVVVRELATSNGCVTNNKGEFILSVSKGTLRIQYTGYEQVDTNYISDKPLLIYLEKISGMHVFACPVIFYAPGNQLPGNYTEIKKTYISQQFNNPIAGVMNTMPGVFMQSGALNTNRLTTRGIGNRSPFSTSKIKVYLDDIPLTNGIGESTIEDLDMNLFDKIKVIKGPGATPYGSNLGGLVHLVTPEVINDNTRASVKTSYGSFGTFVTSNHLALQNGKSGILLSQQYVHSDGFRENNNFNNLNFSGLYKQRIKQSSLNFFINHIDLDAQIPSSLNIIDFENEPRKAADNWAGVMGNERYKKTQLASSFIGDLKNNNLFKLALF
ncbi:MAG: TonB-dependent receptor plug domain-containing protein, partial [Bacteroidia bacterium]|nr:TonB-dependent receptor plug domain-containing protein [Bacteroidia bacterium]